MVFKVVYLFFIVLTIIEVSEACNGYSLKLDHANSCSDDSISKPRNMDIILDKNCNLVVSGCIDVSKPIKTSKATYEVTKAPMPPMTGDVDMCEATGSTKLPITKQIVAAYGFPQKCPIAAKKYCVNGKKNISIAAYKTQLGVAVGTIDIKLDAEHDSGKSCLDMRLTISKKK